MDDAEAEAEAEALLEKSEKHLAELEEHKELYVPNTPLEFDDTGKVLIYDSNDLYEDRKLFRKAMILPFVVFYCGMRAI